MDYIRPHRLFRRKPQSREIAPIQDGPALDLGRGIEPSARPGRIEKGALFLHTWLRKHAEMFFDEQPAMATLLAQTPLRDILLTIRSPAGATKRDLLAAALSKHLKAGKDLPYWDTLRLAKKTDPKLFAEVAR